MKHHRYFTSILFTSVFLATCSNPTAPSPHSLIEQILAHVSISLPPITAENESEAGRLQVAGKCDSLLYARLSVLNYRIRPFLTEDIQPIKKGSSYQWTMRTIDSNGSSACVLTITPGDTLHFRLEWGFYIPKNHTGWVVPGTGEGQLSAHDKHYIWHWGPTDYGFRLSVLEETVDWSGASAVLVDSSNGGGYIKESLGISIQFLGEWDLFGHGTWWSTSLGSGNW